MIHRVRVLPEEGTPVRTRCGHWTDQAKAVAIKRGDVPEGARKCRKCWLPGSSTSPHGKILLLGDLLRSTPGDMIPAEDLKAILEDRYYPDDQFESPKAA